MLFRLTPIAMIAMSCFTAAGCGPGQGDVSGKVTYQNKPVVGCTVTFFDEYNGTQSSQEPTNDEGTYTIRGVKTGTAKIVVTSPEKILMPGLPAPKFTPVPDQYKTQEKTPLSYRVVSGAQTH